MITKWGFGAAPLKDKTQKKNNDAVFFLRDYLLGVSSDKDWIIECCSHVKGMFNRIVKQDQRDWFTVYLFAGDCDL